MMCDTIHTTCVGKQLTGEFCESADDCRDPSDGCYLSKCSRMSPLKLALIITMSVVAVTVTVVLFLVFCCRRWRRIAAARGEPSITFFRLQDPLPDTTQYAVNGNATLERDFSMRHHQRRLDEFSLQDYPENPEK